MEGGGWRVEGGVGWWVVEGGGADSNGVAGWWWWAIGGLCLAKAAIAAIAESPSAFMPTAEQPQIICRAPLFLGVFL